MPAVNLSEDEWQRVLAMIAMQPWKDANPLLLKIGAQLQAIDVQKQDTDSVKLNERPLNPAAH